MKKSETTYRHDLVRKLTFGFDKLVNLRDLPAATCSRELYQIFLEKWDKKRLQYVEDFKVVYMNKQRRVIGVTTISNGAIDYALVDIRVIMANALSCGGVCIALAHNHPSGAVYPSDQDIQLTKDISEAARILKLKVLDHIIITPDTYYSFADEDKINTD